MNASMQHTNRLSSNGSCRSRAQGNSISCNQASQEINVGEQERQWSMVGGTALAVMGLMRGTLAGMALAAIGGAMIWRGHTGHCGLYQMLGHSTLENEHGQSREQSGHREFREYDVSEAGA